jgi:hypothetical protein
MKYRYFLLLVSLLTFFHYGFIQWQVDETIPPTQAMFRATLLSSKNNQKINLHQLNNDPPYDWLTFIESDMCETGYGAELDSSGNLYVLTNRYVSEDCLIQLPMENEIFTTKISSDGNVLSEISVDTDPFSWSESITLDNEDNLYISGTSGGSWGEPLSPFSGDEMVFIAKYDTSNSSILWNTFLGTNIFGWSDVTSDKNNDIYAVWSQFNNNVDTSHYLAKLNSEGILQWSKVIIPNGDIDETSFSVDVLVDQNINIYVLSTHIFDWGSPVREQAGGYDASLAKFDSTGELLWNTFLGGTGDDVGSTVKIDENGFLYVSGYSDSTWGNPINIYQPGTDGFLAKLDLDGTLLWNTFLGGRTGRDLVPDMEIGVDGNLYLAGSSESSWGNPENAFSTIRDGFVAQFDSNGSLLWNTFIGGNDDDVLGRIELDNRNEIRVTGVSFGSFGNPIIPPQGGGNDIFVAKHQSCGCNTSTLSGPGSADSRAYHLHPHTARHIY